MNASSRFNTCKSNVIKTWRTGAEEIRIYLVVLNKEYHKYRKDFQALIIINYYIKNININ